MALCSGCSACTQICPFNSIGMQADDKGFLYPALVNDTCTNCGLCDRTCPLNTYHADTLSNKQQTFYAARIRNYRKRMESQSGGMFAVIAEYVLEERGVVYGAYLTDDFSCHFKRITSVSDLPLIKGSKYVQADPGSTFSQIKTDLISGRLTLFCGTPCQVDGLKNYLLQNNVEQTNLITCDLVCHGVPSPLVYSAYIDYLKNTRDEKLIRFNFRDKACGWHNTLSGITFENDIEPQYSRLYSDIFYSDLCLRDSCYECQYSNTSRVGDFTIGDFWGIEKLSSKFNDQTGTSLLILNSDKAHNYFSKFNRHLDFEEYSMEQCLQHNLIKPTNKPEGVDHFWDDFATHSIKYIIKKYSTSAKMEVCNSIVFEQWKEILNHNQSLSSYFKNRSDVHIALCGSSRTNDLLYADLSRNRLPVVCCLSSITPDSPGAIKDIPLINPADLTPDIINFIDYVIITDTGFTADLIEYLTAYGIHAEKIIPISFMIASTQIKEA
ncbi:MAG: Coenzyme F420 hydrogenase/dehydrogenase, beta subunit C-terminal domain [Lachnospiraceae bacterium]